MVEDHMRPWIAVDLDGTLAALDGDPESPWPIGSPVLEMMERVKRWIAEGMKVKIFTARVAGHPFVHSLGSSQELQIEMVRDWLYAQGLGTLEVTAQKDPLCVEIWDDRAVQVVNGGMAITQKSQFAPNNLWMKKNA